MDVFVDSESKIVNIEKECISETDKSYSLLAKKQFGGRTYVFYCIVTISVVLLSLTFAATELFSAFFSELGGGSFLSKLFGNQVGKGMSFGELLLSQSFIPYTYKSEDQNKTENTEDTKIPEWTEGEYGDFEEEPEEENNNEESGEENGNDIYFYDPSEIPEGMSGIMPMDLSLKEYGLDYINIQSAFTPDMDIIDKISVSTDISSVYPKGAPIALIVHTHGTEAFFDRDEKYYDPKTELARSYDTEKNVVSLGRIIAEILNDNGISTIHCDIMHDAESYGGAYERSAETIKSYLKKYPSIQYVIDVHRDAVVKSSGEIIKPIVSTDKGTAAQMMFVVGTGAASSENPSWKNNLSLAQKLRKELNGENEGICRPTCLRDSGYNQQYSAYSVLIEIGSAGNTHDEAVIAAKTAANALAAVLRGK